jgi:hypothetical protein
MKKDDNNDKQKLREKIEDVFINRLTDFRLRKIFD